MKKEGKKLLVINYYYPPVGGAGVKRALKFIKFLPRWGWSPVVLTVRNPNHSLMDQTLLGEVPDGLPVYRAFTFEGVLGAGGTSSAAASPAGPRPSRFSPRRLARSLYKKAGAFLKVPDSRILWVPCAVLTGVRAVLREGIDAIFATGPTFSSMVAGALIKAVTGKPLVLDFRDAWMGDPTFHQDHGYLLRMNARLERFVVRRADLVITTNPGVTEDLANRLGKGDPSRFVTIYNGFDREDLPPAAKESRPPSRGFTIVHTGILYGERTPRFFLEAVKAALEIRPDLEKDLKIIFAGPCERFHDGKVIQDYLEGLGLSHVVSLTGQVPRGESIALQLRADLLLMIIGLVEDGKGQTYGIPGKLFDYLMAEKPILTLANEGATRSLITRLGVGWIRAHQDRQGIRDLLLEAHDLHLAGKLERGGDANAFSEFDFVNLTASLARHLDKVAPGKMNGG